MNSPLPPPDIPPEQLAELVRAMQSMRDDLLKVSLLLRDHLYETDAASRAQARRAAEALIRRAQASGHAPRGSTR